jgi:hypothetical protein
VRTTAIEAIVELPSDWPMFKIFSATIIESYWRRLGMVVGL